LAQNREFIANAAHDLRSPLAAIQSSVEVTLNADRRVGEYQELLYEIVEECSSLTGLVNQLLLLAESDGPALTARDSVRLDQIVNKSLATRLDPVTIPGDAGGLWQVVNNLLDNALKFSTAGGRVSVDVHHDRERECAIVQVIDKGCGIAAEDLPHVFERFYQGDKSRHREFTSRGNGLGLSICQAIVDGHGGSITAVSVPGEGTQFTIILPALASQPAQPIISAVAPAAS
jgi:signal transduction histidine kinase